MLVLFVSELHYFLQTEVGKRTRSRSRNNAETRHAPTFLKVNPELFVDTSKGQKIRINLDVSFPRLACACKKTDIIF